MLRCSSPDYRLGRLRPGQRWNADMLDIIRLAVALILFCVGVYLTYDLFASGFSFLVLVTAIGCFVLAHYVKPKGRSADDWAAALDLIGYTIDVPFRLIAWLLRGLYRPFRGDIDGYDL